MKGGQAREVLCRPRTSLPAPRDTHLAEALHVLAADLLEEGVGGRGRELGQGAPVVRGERPPIVAAALGAPIPAAGGVAVAVPGVPPAAAPPLAVLVAGRGRGHLRRRELAGSAGDKGNR